MQSGGGDKSKVTLDDNGEAKSREMTLEDLGINPNIAAAGVKLLAMKHQGERTDLPNNVREDGEAACGNSRAYSINRGSRCAAVKIRRRTRLVARKDWLLKLLATVHKLKNH